MDQKKLADIFNKFVGQPLRNPDRVTCDIDDVLTNMRSVAEWNGFNLHVVWQDRPKSRLQGRTPSNRVTVHAEKQPDGSYRVGEFKLG